MELSQFLAKLLGLYLLIGTGLWFFRRKKLQAVAKELVSSKGALAISGEVSLLLGLVIVIDHNIWEMDYKGLITLLGYLFILRGVMRIAFAEKCQKMMSAMTDKKYTSILLISFAIGLYLTYCGFFSP